MDDPLPLDGLEPRKRCSICKQWFPLTGFHRNRSRADGRQNMYKRCNITMLVIRRVSWSRIMDEIEKCEVVCANCHRRRTAARAGTYRYRSSQGEW